jgi:hypothetical protein
MDSINGTGKRKAPSTSPLGDDSNVVVRSHSQPGLVAPGALRRRSDVGPVPAQTRVNIAPRQGALPPRGAQVSSVGPSRDPAAGQPHPLRQATSNIAAGTVDAESAVDPAFPHQQQAEQVVAPDGLSQKIREKYAKHIEKLTPLVLEIKADKATPWAISRRPGMSSFANAFMPNGKLKPPDTSPHARSIHNKLEAILQSHPDVANAFKAALDQEPRLERFASEVRDLIPLILEVKAGASPTSISQRPGMSNSFSMAFEPGGTLKVSIHPVRSELQREVSHRADEA